MENQPFRIRVFKKSCRAHSSTDLQRTMDRASFLVLLLSSSLFFFEGICLDDLGQNPESLQFCSSDIDSVREMRAALAAQQVQIKQLQEENLENKVRMEQLLEGNRGKYQSNVL
uniref:Uncharacterized protein n=1 Tax=Knipowitschia caucasica TaxID=637954 RepID=A0AAV2MHZ8_KNICA